MDCEKLSPNALKIFDKIKTHYHPDPWNNPQWTEEGKVFDNGWHDLKRAEDRARLIHKMEHIIGFAIVSAARGKQNKKLSRSVFNLKASKRWIELAVLLYELDFQIETMDLVE